MKDINRLGIDWLNNNFGNLTKVVEDNRIYYVDENHLPLFYHLQDDKNGNVYLNYDRIWSFFELVFRYKRQQIQDLMKTWLEDTYNLKGKTPIGISDNVMISWKRPIN